MPALEHLAAVEYAEVWVPIAFTPLISFGDATRSLSSTGLDVMGVGELPTRPDLLSRLKSFDHIVSWYGTNRPEFRSAMQATGVSCDFHPALPPADYAGHATDFFSSQVGAPLGLQPRIRVDAPERRHSIVFHPFSGSKRKNWPLESFRKLASNIKSKVEWCSGPEETVPDARRFEDLSELASWISGARLYVGNDSGITHLAAAAGAPVIAIFLATPPEVWAPRGDNVTVLRNPTAEQAAAAINRLLG